MNDQTHLAERTEQYRRKDPWLAVLLSEIFPGAGQIYGGAKARGLFFISLTIALYMAIVLGVSGFLTTEDVQSARAYVFVVPAAILVMFVVDIYVLFDAHKVTKRRNPDKAHTAAIVGYRKPWLAAFLSALIPGIGQFYNGQVIKGIALLVTLIVIAVFEYDFTPLIIVGLLVYVLGIKDAFDSAEAKNGSSGRFFQQEKTIVLFIVIMLSLHSIPLAKVTKENIIEAFKIPSGAMYPTLKIGDHFLLGKSSPFYVSLKRGDIVVFPYPKDPGKNFVKRVIGIGGDTLQIINGELYINEERVQSKMIGVEPQDDSPPLEGYGPPTVYEERIGDATYHIQYLHDKSATNGGPWLVPQDAVFVMGDNRDNSMDSRIWGTVPRSTVKGKALKIYWSWDRGAAKVRWERIGETIH